MLYININTPNIFSSSDKLSIGDIPFIVEESKPRRNQALVYYREVVKHHQNDISRHVNVIVETIPDNEFDEFRHHVCNFVPS